MRSAGVEGDSRLGMPAPVAGIALSATAHGVPLAASCVLRSGGIDGAEDNVDAMVLADTPARALAAGIDLRARLTENDGCGDFAARRDLVVAGLTRTNVNDFRAILIDTTESQAGEK